MHTYTYTYIHTYSYTYISLSIYIYICIYIYIYRERERDRCIYIYTHIYIYTYVIIIIVYYSTLCYSEGGRAGAMCARECPWRFGDTLTFMVSLKDVTAGPGLRVKLRAQSDITLGLVQFQMSREAEIGEACVDLQRRVLPGCCDRRILRGVEVWESPVQLVPLGHVRGGVVSNDQGLGQAVAHVALSFSVDCDPEKILSAIEADAKSVTDVLHDRAERAMNEAGAATERAMRWLNDGLSSPLEV